MHVSRGEVDHYLLSWNMETESLKGSYSAEEALLDCDICHSDEMDPYSLGYVNLHGYRYRFYADAFCGHDIDEHSSSALRCLKYALSHRKSAFKNGKTIIKNRNIFFMGCRRLVQALMDEFPSRK